MGRHEDTYDWCGPLVRDLVTAEFNQSTAQLLDVGPCWGKYRILLPGWVMDACEAWEPYVREENLASVYRKVWTMDVCDLVGSPEWQPYDVVIMGDVLEHIPAERAMELVDRVARDCVELVVVVPYLNEQGPEHGNPHQRHQQADLTPEVMTSRYPGLRLADTEWRGGVPFKGLYRKKRM